MIFKKNAKRLKILGACFFAFNIFCAAAFANSLPSVNPATTENTIVQSSLNQDELKDTAKMWGLTTDDFQHYLWLMKNTPSGHWYKKLDPAEVLALNSQNSQDMMRYAKVQAQNMHYRVTQELLFNKIYFEAYKNLYPNEKAIMLHNQPDISDALKPGDRVWLFLKTSTPLGSFAYQNLLKNIQAVPNTVLDIYFVGKNVSKKDIQQWASDVSVPRKLVNKKITLNFGNSRFLSVTKGKLVNLPFVGIVHNERFQPITLSSVLQ